jgi:hypothetical protein
MAREKLESERGARGTCFLPPCPPRVHAPPPHTHTHPLIPPPLHFVFSLSRSRSGFVPPVQGVSQDQPNGVRWFIQAAFIALPALSAATSLIFKLRFPIKTEAMAGAVQAGIAAHARGEAVPNPLSPPGAPPTHLLRLDDEQERRDVWRYECFSVRLLDELLATGSPRVVVREMGIHCGLAVFSVAASLTLTGCTARYIAHPALSILPVLGAIATGASFCYAAISVARLHAARELSVGDATRHADLIHRMRSVKAGGGRAGRPGEGGGRLLQETLSLRGSMHGGSSSAASGRPWRASAGGLSSRRSSTIGAAAGGVEMGSSPQTSGQNTPGLAATDEIAARGRAEGG